MRDAVTTKIVALARSGKNARVGAGCESSLVSPRAHRPLAAPLDPPLDPPLGGVYVALPDPEL
jgi:hypothetical protein